MNSVVENFSHQSTTLELHLRSGFHYDYVHWQSPSTTVRLELYVFSPNWKHNSYVLNTVILPMVGIAAISPDFYRNKILKIKSIHFIVLKHKRVTTRTSKICKFLIVAAIICGKIFRPIFSSGLWFESLQSFDLCMLCVEL